MANEAFKSSFPASQQDVINLKQTASDAVNDISSAASSHLGKASRQVNQLAKHVRKKGSEHFDQVKVSLDKVIESARDYAAEHPFRCIGAALTFGLLIGLSRRRKRAEY